MQNRATIRWSPPGTTELITAVDVPRGKKQVTATEWRQLLRDRVSHMADHASMESYKQALSEAATVDPTINMGGLDPEDRMHDFFKVTYESPEFSESFTKKSHKVSVPSEGGKSYHKSDDDPGALLHWVLAVKAEGGLT